jgi:acyl-CoA reductase-like NAD-dependent aldehyde dehydrogenase
MSEDTRGRAAALDRDQIEVRNPGTHELVGTVPVMDADEVHDVVAKARLAAAAFAELDLSERRAHLRRVARSLVDHADEIAATCSAETGKPLPDAYIELAGSIGLLRWNAKAATKILARRRIRSWPIVTKRTWVEYSPYGVIGEIAPWNVPIAVPLQTLSAALAAGNVVVLKPSELTPLTGLALQKAINAAGRELLFVVTGYGPTGEALVRAGVDKVAFTGSPNTGRRIMAACADSLTPSVMELGGNDPMIVAADANVTRAAQAAVGTAFFNSGQACVAAERVLVEGAIYDRFVDETVRITGKLRQGSSATDHIGAMTQERQMPIIEERIRAAEAAGARLLVGGHRRPGDGWYFEPTVIADVRPDMELMREETFGPVLSITRVENLDEAVRIANGSEFGLNGSVFTRDVRQGERIASQLLSGGVNVNDAVGGMAVPAAPFGGEKSSGFGRLQGQEGLLEFSRVKTVAVERLNQRIPTMMGLMMTAKRRPSPQLIKRAMRLMYAR